MDSEPVSNQPVQPALTGTDAGMLRRWRRAEVVPFEEDDHSDVGRLIEYVDIIRRRKAALMLVVAAGVLFALLITLPQTPVYQARGSIEIQNLNNNFLNMRNVSPTGEETASDPRAEIQTQSKLLQSESLLDRVIARLDLGKKLAPENGNGWITDWRKRLGFPDSKEQSKRERILAVITKGLHISSAANTRIIEIRFDASDPQIAAAFVNTLTNEFIQQNLESRWKVSQQTGVWLTRQMEDVRLKLEKSEEQLQHYAKDSGLLFTSEKDNVTEEKLRQIQQELSKAQADRVAIQSKYELLSTADPASLPVVLDHATINEYQVRLTDLRRQLAEAQSTLTPSHPTVKKIQAQVATLETALNKERADVIERLRNEFQSAQRRERLLASQYDAHARVMSQQAAQVAHYGILKREVDTNRQLYDSLLQDVQQASMTSALGASNVRVVDVAVPPVHPYRPRVALNLGVGLFAGTFFGIVFVLARERADRTIQRPGDINLYVHSPELGAIPSTTTSRALLGRHPNETGIDGRKRDDLIVSLLSDSFSSAATSVLYAGQDGKRPRLIVVTSGNPGEGKTTVATNLALALAEVADSGFQQSVLLVDADLRKPRLHEIFGVPNDWGLGDLLAGKAPPAVCKGMAYETAFSNLYLLPSGSSSISTAALLHSPRTLEHFNVMRSNFFAVIIDTSPMLHVPEARILGRFSDGVILVTSAGQTMRDAAIAAHQRLTDDGTFILGTILNKWEPWKTNGRTYGYPRNYYRDGNREAHPT